MQKRRSALAARALTSPERDPSGVAASLLVGRRLGVWWPTEGKYFFGVVDAFDAATGQHTVQYDDGDRETLSLNRETWVLVDDEDERKVTLGAEYLNPTPKKTGSAAAPKAGPPVAARLATPLVHGRPACMDASGVAPRRGSPTDHTGRLVAEGEGYRVYDTSSGAPGFEIYSLWSGVNISQISVRCFSRGAVLLQALGSSVLVELPSRVVPSTAKALFTAAGQLYVRVAWEQPC